MCPFLLTHYPGQLAPKPTEFNAGGDNARGPHEKKGLDVDHKRIGTSFWAANSQRFIRPEGVGTHQPTP